MGEGGRFVFEEEVGGAVAAAAAAAAASVVVDRGVGGIGGSGSSGKVIRSFSIEIVGLGHKSNISPSLPCVCLIVGFG